MSESYESTGIIASSEVQEYFPKNLPEKFGLGENVSFFGLMDTGGYKQNGMPVAKYKSLYLTALYDTTLEHPEVLDHCDMKKSNRHWITREGRDFLELQNKHSELKYMSPLLVIILHSHLIKEDKDFIFANFLRYADHEELRGRGIATQVFESVCEKCRVDGLKYIYVADQSKTGWPSKSRLIGVNWLDPEMFDEICEAHWDEKRENVFHAPFTRNLVRVLDDKEHERLYWQMMSKTRN